MIDHHRGVGMLAALEQGRAADVRDRALAAEAQEQLIAHHRAAGGEQEVLKRACAPTSAISDETCSALSPSRVILM